MRYSVNCSILLTHLALPERFAAVSAAGFRAVEMWWPFDNATPDDSEIDDFARALDAAHVELTGLNFAQGNMAQGDRGLVSLPHRSGEFRSNLDVVTRIGERTGCRRFNALYGVRQDSCSPTEQDDVATTNLALAARAVGRIGGTVLLEPISGPNRYPLRTAAEVVAVIDRVAREAPGTEIALLLDVYHLAANDDDVPAAIAAYRERVGHVQIADVPGRGAPGTGSLPIRAWLDDLHGGGYDGWVGLEYTSADTDPFAWLRQP